MIPDLPEGITKQSGLDFYSKLAGNLSDQSSVHVNWHTHRRNPSVCWICDLNILITKVLDLTVKTNISKSSLDTKTEQMSERSIDTEIEDDPEGIPEYETEEE